MDLTLARFFLNSRDFGVLVSKGFWFVAFLFFRFLSRNNFWWRTSSRCARFPEDCLPLLDELFFDVSAAADTCLRVEGLLLAFGSGDQLCRAAWFASSSYDRSQCLQCCFSADFGPLDTRSSQPTGLTLARAFLYYLCVGTPVCRLSLDSSLLASSDSSWFWYVCRWFLDFLFCCALVTNFVVQLDLLLRTTTNTSVLHAGFQLTSDHKILLLKLSTMTSLKSFCESRRLSLNRLLTTVRMFA